MAEVSNNTQQLKKLADYFSSTDLGDTLGEKAAELEIPVIDWPMLSLAQAMFYEQLRTAMEKSGQGLDTVVTALGDTLMSIAVHYEKQEAQYASDLEKAKDAIGDIISEPGSSGGPGGTRGGGGSW